MQYKTLALAATLASGAFAAPWNYNADDSVKVLLSKDGAYPSTTTFSERQLPNQRPPHGGNGPFSKIEIDLGKDVKNTALRCQALGQDQKPLVATRGENVDITFSDADKGAWTFRNPSYVDVSKVVCDPSFVAISKQETKIHITLVENGESAIGEDVDDATVEAKESRALNGGTKFQTINISLGEIVAIENAALRCAAVDMHGNKFTAKRGENIDVTFSDADKGEWTFIDPNTKQPMPAKVNKLVCDPTFKSLNA
ncbi:hypothetical protein EJ04DRAFT_515973 [Polyplosphaeria fusca]|uniref:Uncharacterized protein n=1 Tax=Polyplosphaeria fusca TaxID=682080 RepID=A0A9P4UYP3_9PLEO|nr:hypothetical protein EJ04DRAFT_515973 [Polyplosphaeria fusca]